MLSYGLNYSSRSNRQTSIMANTQNLDQIFKHRGWIITIQKITFTTSANMRKHLHVTIITYKVMWIIYINWGIPGHLIYFVSTHQVAYAASFADAIIIRPLCYWGRRWFLGVSKFKTSLDRIFGLVFPLLVLVCWWGVIHNTYRIILMMHQPSDVHQGTSSCTSNIDFSKHFLKNNR